MASTSRRSELHEDDARTLLKMIGEQNPGPIRSRMVALLRQEVLPPNESEQIQFPPDLVEAVSTAFASDGLLEGPLVDGQAPPNGLKQDSWRSLLPNIART